MHCDVHLLLHELRAQDLRTAAADHVPPDRLRARLGLLLVETGLRLLRQQPAQARCTTRLA